jgi:3-hydroxyacyl-CoA dehydrogenase
MSSSPATGGSGTVAVVGAGAIGLSWTSLFLVHDYEVWVTDPRPDLAELRRISNRHVNRPNHAALR